MTDYLYGLLPKRVIDHNWFKIKGEGSKRTIYPADGIQPLMFREQPDNFMNLLPRSNMMGICSEQWVLIKAKRSACRPLDLNPGLQSCSRATIVWEGPYQEAIRELRSRTNCDVIFDYDTVRTFDASPAITGNGGYSESGKQLLLSDCRYKNQPIPWVFSQPRPIWDYEGGVAISGAYGTSVTGAAGFSIAGPYGTATSGVFGRAVVGDGGTARVTSGVASAGSQGLAMAESFSSYLRAGMYGTIAWLLYGRACRDGMAQWLVDGKTVQANRYYELVSDRRGRDGYRLSLVPQEKLDALRIF
jgi:hypothetical protein